MKRTSITSEAHLVRHYLNGDENSLSILINRHQQKLFSFIYSKVYDRDLAEDIFQDTFIKVINTLKRGKYNEEGKFLPWVMRIAHNLVIDHFRKNNRMPRFEGKSDFNILDFVTDGTLNVERQIIKDQIDTDLRELVKELPKDQLEVLEMRMFKEMSFKEIALKTDVSINTALGRMRYALINLRKLVEKHQVVLVNQ